MDPLALRLSSNSSRPLSEYGTVTFAARGYDRRNAASAADTRFWTSRALESQKHRAHVVTWFAPDEFVAKDYLDHVWSRPVIINGLDSHTKQSRNRVLQMKYAFRDSSDAAVTAVKNLLLFHIPRIQPDVLDGKTARRSEGENTFGEPVWAAEVDVATSDGDKMQLVRLEVLECPIWMQHPNDEIPFLKGFSSPKGELADIFAITVTILLRREVVEEMPNFREQRNRFHSYVHVCVDRELAIAAWLHAIREHGDKHFKPKGDVQIRGGQTIGPWPPEGRLDLYWEGKTIDYEAIFICATSMCFESTTRAESSELLINSAIDELQQKRDGYIGSDPNDDVALRMLKKEPKPGRTSPYAKQFPLGELSRHSLRHLKFEEKAEEKVEEKIEEKVEGKVKGKKAVRKKKSIKREISPDSSLSSVDESPERPDWMEIVESSSTTEEASIVQSTQGRLTSESHATTPSPPRAASLKDSDKPMSDVDMQEPGTAADRTPRVVRQRIVQKLNRAMHSQNEQPSLSGAQRRRRIAEMNPEMEQFAKGI